MTSEARLGWILADAAAECFTRCERDWVYAELGAGETYSAIRRVLTIAVNRQYPLPVQLVNALALG